MANRIVQLELHTICAGQLCFNVLHFQADVAETDLFVIARNIVLAFDETTTNTGFSATKYMAAMADDCFLSAAVARVVGPTAGSKFPKLYAATDYEGALPGPISAASIACNLKLITASGPDYTGRIFYPGVPRDYLSFNRFITDYETAIATLRSDIMAGIEVGAATFEPVVFRRVGATAEPVTNIMMVPNPGTIRKRLSPY